MAGVNSQVTSLHNHTSSISLEILTSPPSPFQVPDICGSVDGTLLLSYALEHLTRIGVGSDESFLDSIQESQPEDNYGELHHPCVCMVVCDCFIIRGDPLDSKMSSVGSPYEAVHGKLSHSTAIKST